MLELLEDENYLLCEVEENGVRFIYLRDMKQGTESLGVPGENVDVKALWRAYGEEGICLPCELLLKLEQKVLVGENSVAELGLTLERLKAFRRFLDEEKGKVGS